MSGDGPVGAVILAAGMSRRYGSPKQIAEVDGRTLLEHAIDGALTAGLAPVVAVVPVWLSRPFSLKSDALRWVRNPFPERGMSLSLRLGLGALDDDATAAVVLLGDQPRVPQSTIAAVLAARGVRPVVVAESGGILAPPVLVERSHFHLVEQLSGDIGLRGWLASNPHVLQAVPVGNHAPDIDTPDDLGRLRDPRMRP
ncbi:MAG: nucleotidyltransferase family protein [Candidatus Limnocylindria bacterium]